VNRVERGGDSTWKSIFAREPVITGGKRMSNTAKRGVKGVRMKNAKAVSDNAWEDKGGGILKKRSVKKRRISGKKGVRACMLSTSSGGAIPPDEGRY